MDTRDGIVPMNSPQRCELTELIKTQCAHCRPRAPRFREPLFDDPFEHDVVATFVAQYSGRCEECDGLFEVGDWISRTGTGDYLCRDCAT